MYDNCRDMFIFMRILCSKSSGYVSSGKSLLMFQTIIGPSPWGSSRFLGLLAPEAEHWSFKMLPTV